MTHRRTGRTVRRVPPPLTRSAELRVLPCSEMLEELPEEPALLLWQTCRSVHLWGQPGPRLRLFAPGAAELRLERLRAAGLDDEPRAALALLAGLLENRRVVDVPRVVEACGELARWAEGRGMLATALAFAQAAAVADAEDASLAVAVGRLARMRAEYERAEGWFEHAVVLARLSRDRRAYAEAYAGLGNLYVQKGGFPRARLYHQRCLRAARRYSLHDMEGAALHNLFGIEIECGNGPKAEEYAEAALSAYSAVSPALLNLALDVAYNWTLCGRFGEALSVASAALPLVASLPLRLLVLADLARAAGGADAPYVFEQAWAEAWTLLGGKSVESSAPGVLLDLAYGAAHMGELKRAERAARKAWELAIERKQEKVAEQAGSLISALRADAPIAESRGAVSTASVRLAARFVEVLQRPRAAAPPG
ncbi:MAG: tetratricopeptide repeat protein [Longimicrobiaceae bacterium]